MIPKFQTQIANEMKLYMRKFIQEFQDVHSRFVEEEESFEPQIPLEKDKFVLRPALMVNRMSRVFLDEEREKNTKY